MPRLYLDADRAAEHPELRPLLALDTFDLTAFHEPFRALVRSDFLVRLLTRALTELRTSAEPFGASTSDIDWLLLRTERFSLGLRTSPRQADTFVGQERLAPALVALPNDVLMGFVGPGQAAFERFRSAFERDQDVFRPDHRLEPAGRGTLSGGDVLSLRAGEDVVRFVHVPDDLAVLELALLAPRRLVWNYDPVTLRAIHAASASVEATRAEFTFRLFEAFEHRDAVPNLLELARTRPEHWVRWKALTTALTLDLDRALVGLRAALHDPHPHVRRAAGATLSNLEAAALVAPAAAIGGR